MSVEFEGEELVEVEEGDLRPVSLSQIDMAGCVGIAGEEYVKGETRNVVFADDSTNKIF